MPKLAFDHHRFRHLGADARMQFFDQPGHRRNHGRFHVAQQSADILYVIGKIDRCPLRHIRVDHHALEDVRQRQA